MQIRRVESIQNLRNFTAELMKKTLSPLCGICQEVGFVNRSSQEKNLLVGSAALHGVHILLNQPNPGKGAYHIGGAGFLLNETTIKMCAEAIERGAQLKSLQLFNGKLISASYEEMKNKNLNIISSEFLTLFTDAQYCQNDFPFAKYQSSAKLAWLPMQNMFDSSSSTYVPAQMVLVGYSINKEQQEPWLTSAVTTGTAVHIKPELALKNALLELIQLDSVMGHWYTKSKAYEIKFDQRTNILSSLLTRYGKDLHQFRFYYLPNPDLKAFTIACVYLQDQGIPKVAIGLGSDLTLVDAMYKAYLEAAATTRLSRMLILKSRFEPETLNLLMQKNLFYDLDQNVAAYGLGNYYHRIQDRFLKSSICYASDLPADFVGNLKNELQYLTQSFKSANKDLFYINLTGQEEETLGLSVVRVWSPQTLSLSLPSAPQLNHPRYNDYGGVCHADPHPYP